MTAKNGATIKEKLIRSDDRSYSYETLESPLPAKNLNARLWVEEGESANRTVIHWDAEFDADGASDDAASKKINGILAAGLKRIQKIAVSKTQKAGGNN